MGLAEASIYVSLANSTDATEFKTIRQIPDEPFQCGSTKRHQRLSAISFAYE
jgi:hypothetical protein